VQFFLGTTALLFQFGENLLGIYQRLRAGVFKVLQQTSGQLLQQMQRGGDRFLLQVFCGRHDAPPGGWKKAILSG